MRRTSTRRVVPLAASSVLVLAACGGSGDSGEAVAVLPSAAPAPTTVATPSASVDPAQLTSTQLDLIGEAVDPSADVESNRLPAVVLDDLTTGRKVNFRNLVPQDRPVLLWMWAPY